MDPDLASSVVQEEMPFKDISYLEFWQPFRSVEQNHLHNFGRGHHEKHFCEIILNLEFKYFLIHRFKHVFWVLKRTVSVRRLF